MIFEAYVLTEIITPTSGDPVIRYSGAIPYLYDGVQKIDADITEINSDISELDSRYNTRVSNIEDQVQINANGISMTGAISWEVVHNKVLSKVTGDWINQSGYDSAYAKITHHSGDSYLYKGRHIPNTSNACNVLFYDSTDTFIGYKQYRNSEYEIIKEGDDGIPNNTVSIVFTSSRDTTSSDPMIFEAYVLTEIITPTSGTPVIRYSGAIPYLYDGVQKIDDDITEINSDISELDDRYNTRVSNIEDQVQINANGISMTGAISFKNCPTHGYYTSDGTYQYHGTTNSVEADVDVTEGEKFIFRSKGSGSAVSYLMYDANDNIVQTRSWDATDYHIITIPANVVKVKFTGHYNYTVTTDPNFELYKITHIIGKFYNDIDEVKTAISSELNNMVGTVPYTVYKQGYYNTSGEWISSNDYTTGATMIDVAVGDSFIYKGRGDNTSADPDRLTGSVVLFDSSDNVVEYYRFSVNDYHKITIPDGVTKALFASFKYQTAPLIFELYKSGAINQIMGDFTKSTLNSMNRAYAAASMRDFTLMSPISEAVVCIGFDDYNLDCEDGIDYLITKAAALEKPMPCYLSLIPNKVTDGWAMAKKCYDNGGEICAHSKTPITESNQGFDILNDKFIRIPEIIGYHGFPVYGIIRAGGNGIETANDDINEFYARASGMKYSDYYGRIPSSGKSVYRLGRTNLKDKTPAQWATTFDNLVTNGGYLILYCHSLDASETSEAYPNGFSLSDFEAIVDEIGSRNINVMTINQLVDKYAYGDITTQVNK